MSLTPPQYKQMKQFLVSGNRMSFAEGMSDAFIKKNFPTYFTPDYTGRLDAKLIKKILKLYEKEKLGSNKISQVLLKENKINIDQGIIGRILTKAKKNKIVKTIPRKDLTATKEQIVQGQDRKIHNKVRLITELDRKQNPNIPKNAKFKIVFATPQGKTTKIPDEFIGVKYYDTKSQANAALNKRLKSDFVKSENPEAVKLKAAQKRKSKLKLNAPFYGTGTEKFPFHHIRTFYGEIPLGTNDVSVLNKLMNSKLTPYNTILNRIADGITNNINLSFQAMNNLQEGDALIYLKKVEELNKQAAQVIEKATKELPAKYKPYIGFNQVIPATDEYGLPLDDKPRAKPIGGTQTNTPNLLFRDMTQAEKNQYAKLVKIQSEKQKIGPIKLKPGAPGIEKGTPLYDKLMKFCPNNLAPGGMVGTCSIDEAITGMKNELAAVRNGSASLGAQSRTANKIKNLGQGGMRAIVKAGLLTDVGLEAAIGFDRFISEGDSPMQALRKSYLTAPLRFSGLMKSPEEGQRDELIKAALDKDKVEFVLDQQELINDRNEAVANLTRLKEQYDNDMLSESFIKDIKKQQQDVLAAKRADIKDMYRSGELSRAEKFITGFQDPQSLKIKDRSYFDALKQAEEKVAAQRGERKIVPFGPIPMARLLKERIGETVTPDRIKKDMQERFGFTEDETTNLIDSLGGFDKFILDVKNEETARLGGVANVAEGGLIGKKSGPPPESGPNPQGLLSLIKRDIKI